MSRTMVKTGMLAFALAGFAAAAFPGAPARAADTIASAIPDIVASHAATVAGRPAPDQMLNLDISLPLRNRDALNAFLTALYDPASPAFRHYLSVQEFTGHFGPTAADYQAAIDFFTNEGLTVTHTWPNRQMLSVTTRVADVERVFHVQMGLYKHPTQNRLFYAPDRLPTLDLAVPVKQVLGLDNYVLPYRKLVKRTDAPSPRGGSGPNGEFDGNDMRTAYYPGGTLTGKGQSVGLMELEGLNLSDVALFFSNGYGPANHVPVVRIKAGDLPVACDSACGDDGEQALDVEYAISMAPKLDSVRVYIALSPEKVLSAMASDNISKALSTSWGWSRNSMATDVDLFVEFEAQGQTNLTASGDNITLRASDPWPEEDVNIVAVGGTDLVMTGTGAAWSKETGWKYSASGPATDHSETAPSYQIPYIKAINGGSKRYRDVSDIAASANFNMELCADGSCVGGYGGTSFASPIWAGFIALVNEYAAQHDQGPVGFINPYLYQTLGKAKNYTSIFHDVTSGKSGRFACIPSYDLVTGFGSPQGQSLIEAFVP